MLVKFLDIFYKEKRIVETTLLSIKAYLYIEDDEELMDIEGKSIRCELVQYGLENLLPEMTNYPNERVKEIAAATLDLIETMANQDDIFMG